VKKWSGSFETGAKNSGTKSVPGDGVETYSSAIRVEGRFTLEPFVDPRNGPEVEYRGKGEAHIIVSAKSVTRYKDETVTTTWVGDYVDTFTAQITNIDPEKGTYELGVDRDLWQQQPHKGKAIALHEVTVTKYGTRVRDEMTDGYQWSDDAGAGFGGTQPLPKQGFILNGKLSRKNGDFLRNDEGTWNTTWQIRPVDPELQEPLKAVAGGPYTIARGGTVNLDGWKSTGRIRSYKWTFEPADAKSTTTIPFASGAGKEGKRVPVVGLAAFKATLTVSDGQKEDSDSVVVTVDARDYATPFLHRDEEKQHPRSIPPRMIKGRDLRYAGGENVCALDDYGAKDSVHILHPAARAGTWKGNGYEVKQVKDAGGPFDGLWYVADYSVRIEREVLVNKYILPKGPPPVRTAKPFYDANKALGNDVDGYLAAVRKHELLHTELMQKALATADPGPKIESLASKDEAAIKTEADQHIQSAEDAIDKASADPLPSVGFKGKIAFPDDATDEYKSVEMEI
jgi:hypothetical protein